MTQKFKKGLLDFSVLLILPIIASLVSFFFNVNAFWSVILFFVAPSIYLSIRIPKVLPKILLFSTIASIPTIIVVDYIAHLTNQWLIPYSVLGFRLFGYVTIEVILWAFFNFVLVLLFYERFLDKHVTKKLYSRKIKQLFIIILTLISLFTVIFIANKSLLEIPYFYLLFGIVLVAIPSIREMFKYQGLMEKFLKAGAYFFFVSFLYEVTALKLDWWRFPSDKFIGWIDVAGVSFPLEELFFWLILFAMAIITAFERFDDDNESKYLER